jgi:MSHA biogenesis protein MshJ
MKQVWKKFYNRIDARNTRERALIFISTIALAGVLLDTFLLAPTLTERKRIIQQTLTDQAEIGNMTAQMMALARSKGADPDVALRARLAEFEGRMSELQRQVDAQSTELVSPEKMAAVLEKILASSPMLQLVEVKVLPRSTVSLEKSAAAPAANQPQEAKREPAQEKTSNEIYRHGVEVTMRGEYLDLVAYLMQIESQPVRMFWDKVDLSVTQYPMVTMRVLVYTISLEKVWITV